MTDEATRRQTEAATPTQSVWLAANAGSGKTRVLIDRVARLLLDGSPPENILCLTYTKAAAGEMQNRLFERLGSWAMMADDAMRDALGRLGVDGPLDEQRLAAARRLFARAIEAHGGLKIQTIHAFCASLLRLFPREAGVSPDFTEMDDRSRRLLTDDVLDGLSSGGEAAAIDGIARFLSQDDDIRGLIGGILTHRAAFASPMTTASCFASLDLPPDFDEDTLAAETYSPDDIEILADLCRAMSTGSRTDQRAADRLAPVADKALSLAALPVLEALFLTGASANAPFTAKTGKFPTKATRARLTPDTQVGLDALMMRVESARPRRLALAAARRNAALHTFAGAFLPAYDAAKSARGWLDFDDLVRHAHGLLSDPGVADWVLFRLDGRIDHILVDEAQDTSPEQWRIIALLARELTVGLSARASLRRTLFVVGDQKQSIYSFQGADPAAFSHMRKDFAQRLASVGQELGGAPLLHSFRSAPAILDVVDATFAEAPPGLGITEHRAGRASLPGRVDLWPLVEKAEKYDEPHWFDPVDRISPRHESVELAGHIARELRRLISTGETLPDGAGLRRPIHAGDILILVQKRSGTLFSALLAACKAEGLDVAGADRLRLLDDLAVRDLLAVLNFLALPEDDLSLAVALRSPLFGWSEDALYRVAQPRKGYLWAALRDDPSHVETAAVLQSLRDSADYLRPYDLIERILTRFNGRMRLLARLGPDVEEAIDALLTEALAYERAEVPSLTGFLVWITSENAEVKRQAEGRGEKLRIMTVHGAKGLEAPVVVLPDCGPMTPRDLDPVLMTDAGWPAWKLPRDKAPEPMLMAADAARARNAEERDRLLYVAMTRAEYWLIICAAGDPERMKDAWHSRVAAGLARLNAPSLAMPTGKAGLRHASGDWDTGDIAPALASTLPRPLPDWVDALPPTPMNTPEIFNPSSLGGAKALPGEGTLSEDQALLRGTRLHRLLEHLPQNAEAGWPTLAAALLDDVTEPVEFAELLAEATAVLTNPDLKPLFAADTLAEVAITGEVPELGVRIHGTMDRLVTTPGKVLVVDYKSNAKIPDRPEDTPEGILRQMAAYAAVLRNIYFDRTVEAAVLWTRSAQLMPLPHALLIRALRAKDMSWVHLDAPDVGA